MKRLFSLLAVAGALSLAMSPAVAPAASAQHHVLGSIIGKHVGTVVETSGDRTFTFHFNAKGKLLNATESGGPGHHMNNTPLTITKTKTAPMGKHNYTVYYDWCYYWTCDYYGYCYYYYYLC